MASTGAMAPFGSKTAFAEPAWYRGMPSPYYNEHHAAFRNKMRKFVDEEIIPHVDAWEKANEVPKSAAQRASEVGLIPAVADWPVDICGPRPKGYDLFFAMIAFDELARCASGGVVWGLLGGMGIGLPPVMYNENEDHGKDLRERVVTPILKGKKRIALAVSEPSAGSDVANIKTTAEDKGDYYIVNGMKKWITCGMFADFFSVACQTGGEDGGMLGVELLLIERTMEGVSTRPMDCMGGKGSGTAYVEFDNVRVPKSNFLGGVQTLLRNFVTERIGIAAQANRFSRVCVQESIEYAKWRVAFGKKLEDQPVVRHRIAEMARQVEATHAYLESLAYRVVTQAKEADDWFSGLMSLGAEAALIKVQATKTFDFCARTAAHLQGGNAYVKGNKIENLYRHVLSLSIPGGSEDVMIDAAARLALKGKL